MIRFHTASFFDKEVHQGLCFSIAFSQPKGFLYPTLKKLVPPVRLLSAYRAKRIDEEEYERRFQRLVLDRTTPQSIVQTIQLLATGKKVKDVTLLCWEREGEFCHRHLVYNWLRDHMLQAQLLKKVRMYKMGEKH